MNDSVKQKVSWKPANKGGFPYRNRRLRVAGERVFIEKTLRAIVSSVVFVLTGLLVILVGIFFLFVGGYPFWIAIALIFGFVMFVKNILVQIRTDDVLIFDKKQGLYFRGDQYQGWLAQIAAIQLIPEVFYPGGPGDPSPYTSHELNIVFIDGERLNVLDHADLKSIEFSAQALAEFLNVPIWQGAPYDRFKNAN